MCVVMSLIYLCITPTHTHMHTRNKIKWNITLTHARTHTHTHVQVVPSQCVSTHCWELADAFWYSGRHLSHERQCESLRLTHPLCQVRRRGRERLLLRVCVWNVLKCTIMHWPCMEALGGRELRECNEQSSCMKRVFACSVKLPCMERKC